jgi:hypothetical protein
MLGYLQCALCDDVLSSVASRLSSRVCIVILPQEAQWPVISPICIHHFIDQIGNYFSNTSVHWLTY